MSQTEEKALECLFATHKRELEQPKEEKEGATPIDKTLRRILAIKELFPENRAVKYFDFDYFHSNLTKDEQQQLLRVVQSGVSNPDSCMGCYAMHWQDYVTFRPFLVKVITDYHGVPVTSEHKIEKKWHLDRTLDVGTLGLPALSMRVRVGRNLVDFPLAGSMTKEDRVNLELKMTKALKLLIQNPEFGGRYYSLTPTHPDYIDEAVYCRLVHEHIMFKDMSQDDFMVDAGIATSWPYGRGCYVSADKQVIIWVGEEDHLRIVTMQNGTILNKMFERLHTVLDTVESLPGLSFATAPGFGYVTSCPTNLGTAMRASVHLQLPYLTRDGTEKRVKKIAKPMGLSVRGAGGEHTPIGADGTVDISPSARFCLSEGDIFNKLYDGIAFLVKEEAKVAATSTPLPSSLSLTPVLTPQNFRPGSQQLGDAAAGLLPPAASPTVDSSSPWVASMASGVVVGGLMTAVAMIVLRRLTSSKN